MLVVDLMPPEPIQIGALGDCMAGLITKYWPWAIFTSVVITPLIVSVLGRCHEPPKPSKLGQSLRTWQPWLAVLTNPEFPSLGMNRVPKDL